MSQDSLQSFWYVLHTKSRFENVVDEGLHKKSLEVYNPKIKVRSKRRDRRVMINVPLFPGYVFVKTDLNHSEYLEILKTAGVVRFVGNTSGPVPVMEEEIGSLKIMTEAGEQIVTGTRFKKGDRIVVVSGPFAGVTGYFMHYRGQGRVVVNIEALGQFAAVNVEEGDLEPVPPILL
jgi:transcription termination/antitermination protein NusG